MESIDWAQVVLGPEGMAKMDYLARKRFKHDGEALEAVNFLIDHFSEDNWRRFGNYDGKAKPLTYLHTMVLRGLEGYNREKYGRKRPPTWITEQGDVWERIWRALCLERQHAENIMDDMQRKWGRTRDFVREAMSLIKAKIPWCGAGDVEIPMCYLDTGSDENSFRPEASTDLSLEDDISWHEGDTLLNKLSEVLASQLSDAEQSANASHWNLNLNLTDEEWLVLRMHYQDGMKKKVIAKALGLPDHVPGRIIKKAQDKLMEALEESNLDVERLYTAIREVL